MTYQKNISRILYKIARGARAAEVISTGDPKKIGKYIKNVALSSIIWNIIRRLK